MERLDAAHREEKVVIERSLRQRRIEGAQLGFTVPLRTVPLTVALRPVTVGSPPFTVPLRKIPFCVHHCGAFPWIQTA